MNTFSKKSLHVAMAGLSTLGLAGAAEAVMVNPNGLGQVLIYPYYTVRNGFNVGEVSGAPFNTLLSIVNTTTSTKAVKVRFREGKASLEVLDFNVFLSPKDMWTAAVEPGLGPDHNVEGAMIETQDNSCTIPPFTKGVGVPFRTTKFDPGAGDPILGGKERLTEGYFEVFEMVTYEPGPIVDGSTHDSSGVPADCSLVTNANAVKNIQPPNGGLSGGATLINVLTGDAFTQDATALTQFTNIAAYYDTVTDFPNLSNAVPSSAGAVNEGGQIIQGAFPSPELASTAALQRSAVVNEFVLEASTLSQTDWVLTFPTKHLLVDTSGATPPFQRKLDKNGSCDDIFPAVYNREESNITPPPGEDDFSPPSPTPTPNVPSLCWEANVITFNATKLGLSNVLGSANTRSINTGETAGWANITFRAGAVNVADSVTGFDTSVGLTFAPATTTFSGLPTIGFAVQTFVNGTLSDTAGKLVQSSYGGNFGHRYVGPQPGAPVPVAP